MKQIVISALVAAIVSSLTWHVAVSDRGSAQPDVGQLARQLAGNEVMIENFKPAELSFSMEPEIAAWVKGTAYTGTDSKALTDASNSVCFLTRVELGGIQGPEDVSSCAVTLDDFTGYWQVGATVAEGGKSEIQCNARCIVWDQGGNNDD